MLRQYIELPRPIHILCIGTFVNRAGTFLIPFLTLYLTSKLHLSQQFATRAMGCFGVGAICAALLGGFLADRIGRRTVMLISLVGGACVMTAFSFVEHKAMIVGAIFCLALLGEMYRPAASAMIGDLVTPARRPHAFSLLYVAINLGFAIGPVLGGEISKYSFQWLFWGDALTSSLYGLIILFAIRETLSPSAKPNAGAAHEGSYVPIREAAAHILRDRPFLTVCAAGFLFAVVFMQSMSTFPLYLAQHNISSQTYGRLIALNGVMIVVLQLPLTSFLARFDRAAVIAIASFFTGTGFCLTAAADGVWQYAATIIIWTLGEIMQASFIFAVISDMAPARMRGRYMGLYGTSFSTAMMLGVPAGGEVLSRLGGNVLWVGCLGCSLIAALLYHSVRRHLRAKKPAHVEPQNLSDR